MSDNWIDHAACRGCDADLFFPTNGRSDLGRAAKAICATCPVIDECLDYALVNIINHGVWGGRTEKERRAYRRMQRSGR